MDQWEWDNRGIEYDAGRVSYFNMGGRLKGRGLNFEDDAAVETTYSTSALYADHVRRWNIRTHGGPIGGDSGVSLSASGGDSSAVAVYQGQIMAY
jgi:hypothetical protein